MNIHQSIAIANHCRFAFETAQHQFRWVVCDGKVSIVLSVNSGWE